MHTRIYVYSVFGVSFSSSYHDDDDDDDDGIRTQDRDHFALDRGITVNISERKREELEHVHVSRTIFACCNR